MVSKRSGANESGIVGYGPQTDLFQAQHSKITLGEEQLLVSLQGNCIQSKQAVFSVDRGPSAALSLHLLSKHLSFWKPQEAESWWTEWWRDPDIEKMQEQQSYHPIIQILMFAFSVPSETVEARTKSASLLVISFRAHSFKKLWNDINLYTLW